MRLSFLFLLMSLVVGATSTTVKHEKGIGERFEGYYGHWELEQEDARFVVIMLSSLGCPGCAVFSKGQKAKLIKNLKKHGVAMRLVDYFLTKKDVRAMAFVRCLEPEKQKRAWALLMKGQHLWFSETTSVYDSLKDLAAQKNSGLTVPTPTQWDAQNKAEVLQRQSLEAIGHIEALPFFFVIDRQRDDLIICDTFENLVEFLEKNVYNQKRGKRWTKKSLQHC